MNKIEINILNIAQQVIEKNNFVLIDSVFRGERGSKVIQFFIDGEKDVTADVCAAISREISAIIDETIPDISSFRLEVSSPGVERSLKHLFQFRKHLNRKMEVEYSTDAGTEKFTGKLLIIEDNGDMAFQIQKTELKINFNNITKANVLISFS